VQAVDRGTRGTTRRTNLDPIDTPTRVTVAVVDSVGRVTEPESYEVTVLPMSAPVLLVGTRRPDADPAIYAPQIAFSLHLTLATPDGALIPLNDDRGVLFARAVRTEQVDIRRVRTLTDPWVFASPDGYVVVASPALADGSPETEAESSVLLFRSRDLISYEEIGLVRVAASGGVRQPGGVYDTVRGQYVLWWTDDEGRRWSSCAEALTGPWSIPCAGAPVVPAPAVTGVAPSHLSTCAVPLDVSDADRLRRRFGRIRNVAVEVAPLQVTAADAVRDLPWAQLSYQAPPPTAAIFRSTDPAEATGPRHPNGSLPSTTFLTGSFLTGPDGIGATMRAP
jgi:hypothetical protein